MQSIACAAAPFVITGAVDGRGFYLRKRHERYRVTIAPDDDPQAAPWELPAERLTRTSPLVSPRT